MTSNVGDYLLARLREWDVEKVLGFPGDGINGILASWRRAGDHPEFVRARHEEMSAFEAVGYAKFSGRVGVCMATSGPGKPSCASVFRQELVGLFPHDPRGQRFSAQMHTLGEFLAARDVDVPTVGDRALVQGHCHERSVLDFDAETAVPRRAGVSVAAAIAVRRWRR